MNLFFKLAVTSFLALAYSLSYAQAYNFDAVFATSIEQTTTLPDSVIGTNNHYDTLVTITRKYTTNSFQLLDGDSNIFSSPSLTLTNTYGGYYVRGSSPYDDGNFKIDNYSDRKINLKLDFDNNSSMSWESNLKIGGYFNDYCYPCNDWYGDFRVNNFVGTGVFEGATYRSYYWPTPGILGWGTSGPPGPAVTGFDDPIFSQLHVYPINNLSSIRVGLIVNTITPVPEPESYAMVLAGLGLITFVRRFKSKI